MTQPETPKAGPGLPSVRKVTAVYSTLLRIVGVVLVLCALLIVAVLFYTTSSDFQQRAASQLVQILTDATGGRVDVGHLSFDPWRLSLTVDHLVVHGTEPAGVPPYLSADRLVAHIRVNMFLTHIRGLGPQSRVSLSYLGIDHPAYHLIVDKDGHTNAPTPKTVAKSNKSVQDTLLDLQVGKVSLSQGMVLINDQAIPFDLRGDDVSVLVRYLPETDRYSGQVNLSDLETKMQNAPAVKSRLQIAAEFGRDQALLKSLVFDTGAASHLVVSGQLDQYANPVWQATAKGDLDLRQLGYLTATDGLNAGQLDLDVHGRSCAAVQQAKPKPHHFWTGKRPAAQPEQPSAGPDCKQGYVFQGGFKLHHADYKNQYVRFNGINGSGELRATPAELYFPVLRGELPGGGAAEGDLRITDWIGTAPSRSSISAMVDHIPLRTIMDTTGPERYGDLGFDSSISGPVTVVWGGPNPHTADTVQVDAKLRFQPVGSVRRGALTNVPVSGNVIGHYDGAREVVNITQINLETPQTILNASGVLGVSDGDPLTNLQVNLQAHDLGEFDQLLHTLDFEAFGKKGTAAIPVVLHGTLVFTGTARGQIADLDVKGHAVADNLAVTLGGAADIHVDSAVGDAEFSPDTGVAIASSTVRRNTAVLSVTGAFRPHRVATRKGTVEYDWDDNVGVDATAKLANGQAADLLQIAGQQQKVPVTGTVNLDLHATGTLNNLSGGGTVSLTNGVAYGEPYQSLTAVLAASDQQLNATSVQLRAHNMTVSGNGGYNLQTKHITAQLAGSNLQLSHIDTFRRYSPDADGLLSFTASMNGTAGEPGLDAKLGLRNVTLSGKPLGELTGTASSSGPNLFYDLRSTMLGAQVSLNGQTSLLGDAQTQAKLTLTGFDIANSLAQFSPEGLKGSSSIDGTMTVSGPLRRPEQLTAAAEFQRLDVKLENIELSSAEPLRASLRDGVVTLDQLHITGEDTDLHASGTATVFGDSSPQGGALHLNANGSISMALAHSFDTDVLSSGKVTFKMAAEGRMKKPELTGDVRVQNVNLALDGVSNGLSNMNGTLAFNQDRLDVKDLTATTGGGQLKIGGSLSYRNGVFADLTATGEAVRVRLYGLSSTANANLRLQGTPDAMLLSGNILVTRFGVGPEVDFTSFADMAGGVQLPPDPDSPTNRIRMDVHVTSAPQLDFQNSYAKLAGTVDLNVRGTVAVPAVLGRIQITEGSASFAGTKYQLQRGSVTFSNPVRIDPVIDLDATARVENYDITIGLHGTTTSLRPNYRSNPPLTQADIFNLLALGRTAEEAQQYQEQEVQNGADPTTNALLGGALNAAVSTRVSKLFGAGSVKIDPAFVGTLGNSAARISVTEPIGSQLTLVFATNVNQTAEQLIQLQYQINQSQSIVATRDESGVYSLVFKIRRQYR